MSFVLSIILLFFLLTASSVCSRFPFRGVSLCKTFLTFWFIILFMRCFHLYDLYEVSGLIYILVLGGCISFMSGYFIAGTVTGNNKDRIHTLKNDHLSISAKFNLFYYIALAFAIFIIVKQLIILLPIIIASGVAQARADMSLDELFLQGDWAILMNYFARPFVKASLIIMVVRMFRSRIEVKEILLTLLILIVAFASEGGRLLIMDVFFAFLYMFIVNRKHMRLKSKHTIYKVIAMIFLFIVYSTLERGSSFFENFYTYYLGGLSYLDQAIRTQSQLFEPSLYGLNCYQGLFKPIFGIFDYCGIPKPEGLILADKFILDAQATVLDISPNGTLNYYMTIFGYTYRDGGFIFTCIDMFIYGAICFLIDKSEHLHVGDTRWTAIKILFFYTMLYTMAASPFATFMPVMTFVYIIVITNSLFSKKIVKNNKTI